MSLYQRIMLRGVYPYRASGDELPLSDQPVYDRSRPLGLGEREIPEGVRWPRQPDPIVFGIPLERHEVYAVDAARVTTCYPCGVKWATDWAGDAARCWHCGRAAARFANPLSD